MTETQKKQLDALALSIRTLSMDGVEAAKSGHPGLPFGCAEFGALLYSKLLKHCPVKPDWINRDRFVLSAGHGSMFLYSLLHLTGYGLSLDEVKNFRQQDSLTPGHPEYGHTTGVETTTGPLGAGFSNAVGMAIAETYLAEYFNRDEYRVVDHYTWSLAGDGCMMEGVTQEAASLAGHLKLGKLIVFYDSNRITIEGDTDLAYTEDTAARFAAYNWQVLSADGYDYDSIEKAVSEAKAESNKPTLIVMTTTIGKGAPNKAGSHEVHGAALGKDEITAFRKANNIPEDRDFYIHPEVAPFMTACREEWMNWVDEWNTVFEKWSGAYPELRKEWDCWFGGELDFRLPEFKTGDAMATRSASGAVIQELSQSLANLLGGSADLAPSNNSNMKGAGDYSAENRQGRNFHFGIREHAMGGVANGILLHGGLRTFCATFLVFSDYMRPTLRLAALMNIPQIFVFTHDSIFVGEDGPTHQPIEHVESLRLIPGLNVLRPADAEETALCWKQALENSSQPSVLILTRQKLEVFEKPADWEASASKGGYVAYDCDSSPEAVIFASGSEVTMAITAAEKSGKAVRVISVFNRELFFKNSEYAASLVPAGSKTMSVEAGVTSGWKGYTDVQMGIDRFGMSAPGDKVAEALGFTVERLMSLIP